MPNVQQCRPDCEGFQRSLRFARFANETSESSKMIPRKLTYIFPREGIPAQPPTKLPTTSHAECYTKLCAIPEQDLHTLQLYQPFRWRLRTRNLMAKVGMILHELQSRHVMLTAHYLFRRTCGACLPNDNFTPACTSYEPGPAQVVAP